MIGKVVAPRSGWWKITVVVEPPTAAPLPVVGRLERGQVVLLEIKEVYDTYVITRRPRRETNR